MLIRKNQPAKAQLTSLHELFRLRVAEGILQADPAQQEAIGQLQQFVSILRQSRRNRRPLLRIFAKSRTASHGIYLYGDVGRGKSMLMDLLIAALPDVPLRRVHFHAFMLEIHQRLFQMQLLDERERNSVLPRLAQQIAAETELLCFDEFHVSNIADAMILGRLFEALFKAGVSIFVTSNWPPDDLYKGGLQRERFLPFIELLKQKMHVHYLAGRVDHRLEYQRSLQNYLTPLGNATSKKLQEIFSTLTDNATPEALMLPVQGRTFMVRNCAKGVASFQFSELCDQPLSAADYLALASSFHTLIIDGVPIMESQQRNEALRFMTLIDALYESKVQIFMGAAATPDLLCAAGDHAFAFQRTASRLMEMQSASYREQGHMDK